MTDPEQLRRDAEKWVSVPESQYATASSNAAGRLARACLSLLDEAEALVEAATETLREYDLWAEDANDGEFAIWSRDRFMASFVPLRDALAEYKQAQKEE